jgi:hypothetical protein
MFRILAPAAAVSILVASSAYGSPAFFVAFDHTSKKCVVVEKRPDGKRMVELARASFSTKAAAEAAMDRLLICNGRMR